MSAASDLSTALQAGVAFTFSDAVLTADGAATVSHGRVTSAAVTHDCLAKIDLKRTTLPDAGSIVVTRVIILADSIPVEPKPGNVIAITGGETFTLGPVTRDGIRSHWVCDVVTKPA